ncbi:MAG: acyl carrier protein [candidate division Zixibacteria bacterium HGW-Zixibacteria-1]|nr:MAG: acyl carrier protein [candidate division Zixibacteria bacterium HGW-Zixibacteria-1]
MAIADQVQVQKKLKDFITETFLVGSDISNIAENDSFMEKEIIDSTGVLELTAFVETEFGINIEDNEMIPDNLDSIAKLVKFIARKSG